MDHIEFEKDLIAILLVVESVHDRNKLLYKYEQVNTHKRRRHSDSLNSPYSIVIANDFEAPSMKDDDPPRTTFRSFDETTLSILTATSSHGTHVAVQVDDVMFVGHALGLGDNQDLKSFAIFFALRAIAKPSVIASYQEMSKRIGTAIRLEEQRTSYLNQEYAKLMAVIQQHDAMDASDRLNRTHHEGEKQREREVKDRATDKIYSTMVELSHLAQTLKQIYIDLQTSGEINIKINNWLNVSCCLPHRSIAMNCPLDMEKAMAVLSDPEKYFRSYYGLLLVIDQATLLASLPTDSSSTLNTLVRRLRSSYSMSRLSIETSIPLSQIYRLASHLLYWGRAKVIYPIHDDNIYIISPDADISKQGSLSNLYKDTFQNSTNYSTLQEALAEYSDAVTFYDHICHIDSDSDLRDRIECVEWLLRHRLIVQVHSYYFLNLQSDRNELKVDYKRTLLNRPRGPFRRNQYSSDAFGVSAKSERFYLPSENIDIRGNGLSKNGFEYNMASSPMNNSLSLSSAQNSRSIDQVRTSTGTIQDDASVPGSVNSNASVGSQRLPLRYLPQVEQALLIIPLEGLEGAEYRQRLATAINDAKEQDVTDFLRIFKYLNGQHHLEEIASLENLTRLQLLTIIEKFQDIIVRALHPDPNEILQI